MPFETKDGIVRAHAAAVVDDLNEGPSGVRDHDVDLGRTGVQRILHQFLHDGSRPLDNLSGGDHIGDIARQDLQFHYSRE